jgi:3-deoxy-manno-octulosonate cytidylyltransferase (CMP-KDO synthetase)
LEQEECLEQLRVLEAGYKIKTVETTMETIGVDTPADIVRVETYMKAHGLQ